MILTVLLLLMFLAVTGLVVRDRLWGAMLRFLNVLFAATMATVWYEPLAALGDPFVDRIQPPFGQFFDAAAVWGLFLLILLVLRIVTWFVSKKRVPFPAVLDWGGGAVMAALTAWVMVCFTAMTFHMAPLSRDAVQPTPDARMFLGLAPDRKWLAWVRGSTGAAGPFASYSETGKPWFDPDADFVLRYADRRWDNLKEKAEESGGSSASAE